MPEYYTSGISRKRTKRVRRSTKPIWLILLDALLYLTMTLLVVASVIVLVCQYISPAKTGILSTVSLAAPILYLLDVVVALYWVVRMRWQPLVVMLLVVIVGAFYAPRYFVADVWRDYNKKHPESRYIKILSYNVRGGLSEAEADTIRSYRADILCLQEAAISNEHWKTLCTKYNTTYREGKSVGTCHILTRYRILRSGQIDTLHQQHGVWADIAINKDTLRVVNLHLQSTSISSEDTKFLEHHEYIHDEERDNKFWSIVTRLADKNVVRAAQADVVRNFLENTKYRVVLCGDLNDVPMSYTYRTIRGDLNDAFLEAGDGYAYTYNTEYRLLRIDNIFVSPSIDVATYEVDTTVHLSDHYPVIARIKKFE
ncbi:MAG: endonuclease/exonuclease/phosphatase family protein [Alistipes sp.]|nr:endonuclease/exonuclease/phosphatase family protein [Alistipes sp.]